MSDLDEIFDKRRTELDETADRLAKSFNLRDLDEDTLHNLNYAIGNVLREKRKVFKDKQINELKERYEGRYFASKEIGVCYIDEIIDEYRFKGWRITPYDPDALLGEENDTYFFKKGIINDILADRLSMSGRLMDSALIKDAKELTTKEAEEFLENTFRLIRKDYLK